MSETSPLVSIVIPTYERPHALTRCLASLAEIDFQPEAFEVIVANDGGSANLSLVVAEYDDAIDVRLLDLPHAGCATARNAGAQTARGRYLAFTDDDCRPSRGWLSACVARLETAPDRMIGGRTINGLPQNLFAAASQTLIGYLYDYYNAEHEAAQFFTSNNIAMSRDQFLEVGGFDPTVPRAAAEDRELCDRWLHRGFSMTYAPEMIVWHDHNLSMSGFWEQHFRYGRGAHYYHQMRATRGSDGIEIEPLSFYTDLLRYPFTTLPRDRAAAVAPLIALSQVANAAGFLWEQVTRHGRS